MGVHPTEGKPARVLFGVVGFSDEPMMVRDHLGREGWKVESFDPVPLSAVDALAAALPETEDAVMAIIVVESLEMLGRELEPLRLAHTVGLLQGKLDSDRVVVIVDEDNDDILKATDVVEIRYRRQGLQDRLAIVDLLLSECVERRHPRDVVSPDSTGRWDKSLARLTQRIRLDDAAAVFALALVGVGAVWYGWAGIVGLIGAQPWSDEGRHGQVDKPDSAFRGDAGALPVRCRLDITVPLDSDQAAVCENGSVLSINGYRGPWTNTLATLSADPGVVGRLEHHEANGEQLELRPLSLGVPVNEFVGAGGAKGIELLFSADGQSVRLGAAPSRGGNEAVLVFALGP